MYKYFKIRMRTHQNRIEFYLLLLVCAFVGGNSATFATVIAITIHIRCLFCFVADRLRTYNSQLVSNS